MLLLLATTLSYKLSSLPDSTIPTKCSKLTLPLTPNYASQSNRFKHSNAPSKCDSTLEAKMNRENVQYFSIDNFALFDNETADRGAKAIPLSHVFPLTYKHYEFCLELYLNVGDSDFLGASLNITSNKPMLSSVTTKMRFELSIQANDGSKTKTQCQFLYLIR